MSTQPVTNFTPIVSLTRRPDGRWTMEFDWSDSLYSHTDADGNELDDDSAEARAACAAVDAWVKMQPPALVIPAAPADDTMEAQS